MFALLLEKRQAELSHQQLRELKTELIRTSIQVLAKSRSGQGEKSGRNQSLLSELFKPCLQMYCSPGLHFQEKKGLCVVLSVWLSKAIRCCNQVPEIAIELQRSMREEDFQALLDSMLIDWDLGPNIHTPLRDIFDKCLSLQKLIVPTHAKDHKALLIAALAMDQSQKSLYYAIESLEKALGTSMILACEPSFFALRLPYMQETSTVTPLSRLLVAVMLEKLPSRPTEEEQISWLRLWQEPVLQALYTTDSSLSTNCLLYVVPILFQASKSAFNVFVQDLISQDPTMKDSTILRLTIDCLRKGKDRQVIGDVDDALIEQLHLPQSLMQIIMTHEDAMIRVSAIDLLLAHPRPSTMFSSNTYRVLQDTMSSLFYETDMHCRKQTLDGLRSFFIRFQASLYACKPLQKRAEMQNDTTTQDSVALYIEQSKMFAMWLKQLLKNNLEAGCGYQIIYMTLQMLVLAADFGWHGSPPAARTKPNAFQFSRKAAFDKELPFVINLFDQEMIRLLIDRLGDSFDDNRALSLTLLSNLSAPLPGLDTEEEIALAFENAQRLIKSTRGREGDGGARVLQFLFSRFILKEGRVPTQLARHSSKDLPPAISCIDFFLTSVMEDCRASRDAILVVAQTRPLHGRLIAIRYMIESIDYDDIVDLSTQQLWRDMHGRILQMCSHAWSCIKEVLCDDSPEGNLPKSIDSASDDALRDQDTQVILSFCWRALRETSELLRAVLARAPFTSDCELLTEEHFLTAGELSLAWLTEVRHRGAFSAVFPNFVEIARRLQNMKDRESLSRLPRAWLTQNIHELSMPHHSKDITRRSGGLPMSIISLMLSEIESGSGRHELVDLAMQSLLKLVLSPIGEVNDKTELPQVHGFNTLKDIFLESKLAPYSIDYLEECFIISIDGFSSPIWAIRNCALMLYSALIRRAFGSHFSRLDSTTNTLSAATFFQRYPRVLIRLIEELDVAHQALVSRTSRTITTGLNPCLTLLSRLDRAEATEAEEDDKFEPLIRLLVSIATSHMWQVRSMAAQAIPTFIEDELVGSFIVQQLNDASTKDQNALHGRLLMVQHLLESHLERHDAASLFVEQVLSDFRRAITSRFVEFTSENPCATTEALWLRILLFLARSTNPQSNTTLRQRGVDYCSRELAKPFENSIRSVGASERHEIMTTILLRALVDPTFRKFQSSSPSAALAGFVEDSRIEVRMTAYRKLDTIFASSNTLKSASLHMAIESQSMRETWPIARIAARECLSRLPTIPLEYDASTKQEISRMYFADLKQVSDGSPHTDISLKLLGRLMSSASKQELHDYSVLLARFTQENQSADTRRACLESLKLSRLLDHAIMKQDNAIDLLPILLDLLCDDDQEIRQEAAALCSEKVLQRRTTTPERTRSRLINFCAMQTSSTSSSIELQHVLLNDIMRQGSPRTQLLAALQPSDLLFAIERQNLWRNPVSNCRQALAGLSQMTVSETTLTKLAEWSIDALAAIREQVALHETDGPLGWTSIEDAWQVIRTAFIVIHWLLEHNATSASQRRTLQESLDALRQDSVGKHMHPSFMQALNVG